MNLPLTSRTEEIANKIPKKYKNIILNSIIAKSLENGIFIEEVSLYFSSDEVEEIIKELGVKYIAKKPTIKKNRISKESQEIKHARKKEEEDDVFVGFDKD